MSLLSTIPFAQKTVYSIEFPPKTAPRVAPLVQGVEPQIVFNCQPFGSSKEECIEQIEHFRKKMQLDGTSIMHRLDNELDLTLVNVCPQQMTTYQAHYCPSTEKFSERKTIQYKLPKNWVTQFTTQKSSYRQPKTWGVNMPPSKPIRPSGNLTPNEGERAIRLTSTGESIYMSGISNTGDWIMQNPEYLTKSKVKREC